MVDITSHMTKARDMGLENGQVPVEYYTSPDYFAREQDMIFRRAWLMVGRVEEVSEPGDFIVRDLPTLDANVIISRGKDGNVRRSEEHTSELQSLMRISYAVFCLKKKKKHNHRIITHL